VTITRDYDVLRPVIPCAALETITLQCPGEVLLPQAGLRVECMPAASQIDGPDCFTVLPAGPLVLRHRLSGDAIRLPGGTKTLKKLFIDRKIPAMERRMIPVVADAQGVVGVYGIGANQDRLGCGVMIRFIKI
jgi:tRNA(Ile)-lysidine synthetase-like protein